MTREYDFYIKWADLSMPWQHLNNSVIDNVGTIQCHIYHSVIDTVDTIDTFSVKLWLIVG